MQNKTTTKEVRKRKALLLLPLILISFITMAFWALGGGKNATAQDPVSAKGLNLQLPEVNLKDDKNLNKLSFYEQADKDSLNQGTKPKSEPFLQPEKFTDSSLSHALTSHPSLSYDPTPPAEFTKDANEAKVYQKISELNRQLATAKNANLSPEAHTGASQKAQTDGNSESMNRLQDMLAHLSSNGTNSNPSDPEINQLNGMMDKILDIQHPERIKEKIRQTSEAHKGQVFTVTAGNNSEAASLLGNDIAAAWSNDSTRHRNREAYNAFYSLTNKAESSAEQQNAIEAVIYETQTLVDGSIVKLRVLSDIYINGTLIPKDIFIFGTASLNGERLNIQISSLRYKNTIFPVQLSVVDMDGMSGIYIPGAISRDVAKQSADRAVQGININSLDPSLPAQAASAGIEAAKTLLSKKARLVKVTLKAGYRVLLQDEKQKTSF